MKVYLVIQNVEAPRGPEIQGVFTTSEKAIEACRTWDDMWSEFTLDEELPRERIPGVVHHPADKTFTDDGGVTWKPEPV